MSNTEIPDSLKRIDVKALLRKRGVYHKLHINQELKMAAKSLLTDTKTKKRKASTPVRHPQFTNEQILEYGEKQIHIVEVVEAQFENKVHQFITKVESEFLKTFDQEVSNRKSFIKFVNKDYFTDNEENLQAQAQIDFAPLLQNVAVLAGNEANKLIGIKDPYLLYNFEAKIASNVKKFTASMLNTDRDKLTGIITNGLENGKSVPDIRKEIETTFDQYSKMQAQRITRTEVIRVSNQSALDAYERSGVVEGKQWVAFNAVDECADYDGKIETLDKNFYTVDSEFTDGDPPLHPNCKCVIVPIVVGTASYTPDNTKLVERVKELEDQIDKRTKEFKQIKEESVDDKAYIKALEKYLDGSSSRVIDE